MINSIDELDELDEFNELDEQLDQVDWDFEIVELEDLKLDQEEASDILSDTDLSNIDEFRVSGENDQPVKLANNDRSYRGDIVIKPGEQDLMVTNYVELENYLKGVVPAEVYLSWNMEALKAQAVAARSYGIYASNNSGDNSEFDMTDCQESQVYRGYSAEDSRTNEAVEKTEGEMIYYQDEVINAIYHSNAGGYTEQSEYVWGSEVDYLTSVDSHWDESALDDGAPESYQWEEEFTHDEISEKINEHYEIGDLTDIEVLEYSPEGRVKQVLYRGDEGDEEVFGDSNRTPLELRSTKFEIEDNREKTEVSVKSGQGNQTSFKEMDDLYALNSSEETEKVTESEDEYYILGASDLRLAEKTLQYLFTGYGFGHGLGMSQWGAHGMAEEGYDYKEILTHYYTEEISVE